MSLPRPDDRDAAAHVDHGIPVALLVGGRPRRGGGVNTRRVTRGASPPAGSRREVIVKPPSIRISARTAASFAPIACMKRSMTARMAASSGFGAGLRRSGGSGDDAQENGEQQCAEHRLHHSRCSVLRAQCFVLWCFGAYGRSAPGTFAPLQSTAPSTEHRPGRASRGLYCCRMASTGSSRAARRAGM